MFAEIPSNTIRKWTPGSGVSIFLQPSGYKGSEPYGGPESGSNGMTLDAKGRLTVAGHAQRDIVACTPHLNEPVRRRLRRQIPHFNQI